MIFFKHSWKKVLVDLFIRTDKKRILAEGSYVIYGNEFEKLLCSVNLHNSEKTFLRIIYKLTVGSGRNTISISFDKMVEHGMSRRSAMRARKSLEEKGLIGVKKTITNEGWYNNYWIKSTELSVYVNEFERLKV